MLLIGRVDQELAEAVVAGRVVARRRTDQGDHVVAEVRAAGPDLPTGDQPAAIDPLAARPQRGEVGPGVRFAHADAEIAFAADDARQDRLPLLLGAEAKQERTALAIGDPVQSDRSARRQQFLGDDVAIERGQLMAAILLRPRHAQPTLGTQLAAELGGVARRPGVRHRGEAAGGEFFRQKSPDVGAELFRFGAQVDFRKAEASGCHARVSGAKGICPVLGGDYGAEAARCKRLRRFLPT